LLQPDDAVAIWLAFLDLPIEYVDLPGLRVRAWEIAERTELPTLYDAAFLACTEVAPADEPAAREFWTADAELLDYLGVNRPAYVRQLWT
jgi:predicted nucleic acid-binding protein